MYIGMMTMMSPPGSWWGDVTATTAGATSTALKAYTMYNLKYTADGQNNGISLSLNATQTATPGYADVKTVGINKMSRTASWSANWRSSDVTSNATCSDDGFSWPHRTLGWKMLKDDLFGIDIGGDSTGHPVLVSVGETRSFGGGTYAAHDVDSVCLDCHNPTVWNATTTMNHTDSAGTADDFNDDLLYRGLP